MNLLINVQPRLPPEFNIHSFYKARPSSDTFVSTDM